MRLTMKIVFFDTKKYDQDSFERIADHYPELEIEYLDTDLSMHTVSLAEGADAVCAFVSSDVGTEVVHALADGRRVAKRIDKYLSN